MGEIELIVGICEIMTKGRNGESFVAWSCVFLYVWMFEEHRGWDVMILEIIYA